VQHEVTGGLGTPGGSAVQGDTGVTKSRDSQCSRLRAQRSQPHQDLTQDEILGQPNWPVPHALQGLSRCPREWGLVLL
jgi:hypothetical protein